MIKRILFLLLGVLVFLVFKNWFTPASLSSGDWLYRFPESIPTSPYFPYAWDPHFNAVLGSNTIFLLGLNTYFVDTARLLHDLFHLDWNMIERLVWFYPYLFFVFAAPYFLAKWLLKNTSLSILSSIIYALNTYSLLIASGGQIGIGMAYAVFPLVLLVFLDIFQPVMQGGGGVRFLIRKALLAALSLTFLILFDLRIFYVGIIFMFFLFAGQILIQIKKINYRKALDLFLYVLIIPFGVTFLVHSFWLVPFLLLKQNPLQQLGDMYTSVGAVKFFSFTFLENAISLLHPNWPENLFGKVYFMRPEFLLFPAVAFSFFLFKKDSYEKFFAVLAVLSLASVFLAKGTNDPFGQIYILLFLKVPFFQMLRDSTKWFLPIAVSYSILIPLSIFLLSKKIKIPVSVLVFLFLIIWLFSIRQVFTGVVGGTFKQHAVPEDYQKFEKMLSLDKTYYRTLWAPKVSRYAYYDMNHPRVSFDTLFNASYSAILPILQKPKTERILQEASVRYVVIPYDSQGEIYMKDRRYDPKQYEKLLKDTKKISYFSAVSGYGKLGVYEIKGYKPHVFLRNGTGSIEILKSSPSEYTLKLTNVNRGDMLVFSETYDPYWKIEYSASVLNSVKAGNINSYTLERSGSYNVNLIYEPQKMVTFFTFVSLGALVLMAVGFAFTFI